jgi:membrane associated rhomboid family serine protease
VIPLGDDNPLERIRFQYVTVAFIAACVLVFLWQTAHPDPEGVFLYYGLVPALITGSAEFAPGEGEISAVATVVTSMFLHGGFMHLAGNMLYLWIFGDNIEDSLGHARFVAFYVLCGTAAAMAQVAADPDSVVPMVGASGAISGVLGAYLILHPRTRVRIFIPILLVIGFTVRVSAAALLVFWIVFQILNGALDPAAEGGGTAWWAHIGGFLAGMALIVPMRQKGVPLFDRGGVPADAQSAPRIQINRTPPLRPARRARSRIPDAGNID